MESTNQVAHQLEGLTLNTGTTQVSSLTQEVAVVEVVHDASSSTTGISLTSTHSASDNTPHVAATSSATVSTTTTASATITTMNNRINVNKMVNLLRAQAIALGQVPPPIPNHHTNTLNRLHNAQRRLQALRRSRHHSRQVNRQVNRPTVNMLRQLEARQRAPVQIAMTAEERAAAERAEREREFWYVVARVGMTHLVGQRELDEWMAKYQ